MNRLLVILLSFAPITLACPNLSDAKDLKIAMILWREDIVSTV